MNKIKTSRTQGIKHFIASPLCFILILFLSFIYVPYCLSIPLNELTNISWLVFSFRVFLVCLGIAHILLQEKKIHCLYFLLLLFALNIIAHYRGALLYHWDEWDVLKRYQQSGMSLVFKNHGAHIIPLFLLFFFSEAEVLRFSYPALLLVSAFLVALNGLILNTYLFSLDPKNSIHPKAKILISTLFVINSLQLEANQWAFIQCVVIQNIFTVFAASEACLYLTYNKQKHLYFSLAAIFISPFMHASGITTPFFCLLSIMLYLSIQVISASTEPETITISSFCPIIRSIISTYIKPLKSYLILSLISLVPILLAYQLLMDHENEPSYVPETFSHLPDVLTFFLSGILSGTILRGLGLMPSLEFTPSGFSFLWLKFNLQQQQIFPTPHHASIFAGALVLLFVLALIIFSKHDKLLRLSFFLTGIIVLALFFITPSLARWQFGLSVSLFQRYHIRELIGLVLIALPFLSYLLFSSPKSLRFLSYSVLFIHLVIQLRMSTRFHYFVSASQRTAEVLCELDADPNKQLQERIYQIISPTKPYTSVQLLEVMKMIHVKCKPDWIKK